MPVAIDVYETLRAELAKLGLDEAVGAAAARRVLHVLNGSAPPRLRTVEIALKRQRFEELLRKHPTASDRTLGRLLKVHHVTIGRWRAARKVPEAISTLQV
jgi:hypothetical protein